MNNSHESSIIFVYVTICPGCPGFPSIPGSPLAPRR